MAQQWQFLTERFGVVFAIKPADHNAAGVDADSILLKLYRHISFVLQFGALTGDSVLKVYSGATDGAKTTAEPFDYRLADADQGAANADQYGDRTTVASASSGLTLAAATYDNRTLVVEVDVAELTADQGWVTLEIDDTATALFVGCVAVLSGARFEGEDMPTALA